MRVHNWLRRSLVRSSDASNRFVGWSSSATPVKCAENSSHVYRRAPAAGSWTTIDFAPANFSTTKWFISQWTMAGVVSFPNIVERHLERTATQVQASGHLHDGGQRHARRAGGETSPERRDIRPASVKSRHHGETRQATLGSFVLANHRQPADAEVEESEVVPCNQRRSALNGSDNQPRNERCSRMMLPSSNIPGWSSKLRPNAITCCEPSRTTTR